MSQNEAASEYVAKAIESLEGAESELANRRFNNCANRSYYACFQAAVAALIWAGIQPRSSSGQWGHDYVQVQFVGQLINRRRRYSPTLRQYLNENMAVRHIADYDIEPTTTLI